MNLWAIAIITIFVYIRNCDSKLNVPEPSPERTDKLLFSKKQTENVTSNSTTETQRNAFRNIIYKLGKRRPGNLQSQVFFYTDEECLQNTLFISGDSLALAVTANHNWGYMTNIAFRLRYPSNGSGRRRVTFVKISVTQVINLNIFNCNPSMKTLMKI